MSITLRRQDDAQSEPEQGAEAGKGGKAGKGAKAGKAAKEPRQPKAPRSRKDRAIAPEPGKPPHRALGAGKQEDLRIGVEPRVDLLPPEVRSARRNRRLRRGFGWGVLVVLLAVVLASGGAFALSVMAQTRLIAARAQTTELLAEQQKYSEVREVQKQAELAEAAQRVGASTEIVWKPFLDEVGAVQPAGLAITSLTMDSASPIAVYQQSPDPLQGPRVGTVTIVAASPTLPDVPQWVRGLQKISGVTDVVPGSVSYDETSHKYTATVTIHVDDSLFAKRFEKKDQ